MKKAIIAFALLAPAALLLTSQQAPPERPGLLPDGRFLLHTGWVMEPAGRQIPLSTFPMASAVSPDGKYVVILEGGYRKPSVSVFTRDAFTPVSSLPLDDAWLGIVFAPDKSGTFYVSGGSRSCVYELQLTPEGQVQLKRTFTHIAQDQRKHSDFTGDVTVSPDGRLIYAAALHRDTIWVINPQSGMVIEEWKSAHRPYRILFHPDSKSFYVTGWGDGSLWRHDTVTGKVLSRAPIGAAPMDMLWRDAPAAAKADAGGDEAAQPDPYVRRLYVALANTNTVAVFGDPGSGELRPIERINVALSPVSPAGMTPSSLAISPDQSRLYVVCSDANSVAAVDVTAARSQVLGFIPSGWYPTAARAFEDGSLMILNGRGQRSFPNPKGPNPERRGSPLHLGIRIDEYVAQLQPGSASLVPAFDAERLAAYTRTVLANSPYNARKLDDAGIPRGNPIPNFPGDPSPIQHVIYIVKENRTYDQVLGDLGIGNGDPSLTLFTEDVAPNHRKLARDFVLLDNFYVNADVSADGHNWSAAAIAPPYVQRMWPNSYAGRRRHYDYEGGERAALPPAGYIWNNVLSAGLSMRNYGWWCGNITPLPAEGQPMVATVRDATLKPHTSMNYRAYDLNYKDINRARTFINELKEFEAKGEFPRFITLRLGNDHTSGTAVNKPTPKAQVADNDWALGMVIEALSKSKFWPKTAVFVLEDDAQNGPDHVDSHRSPAFVLSPYTRGRGIDSSMYNTVSMLRTMGLILGLRPMTIHDAGARPMFAAFQMKPDARPYEAVQPKQSLDELNQPNNPTAARSQRMDWDEADRIDDNELNEILWLAIKGTTSPTPVRSFFSR